jgi:hypothetical protein
MNRQLGTEERLPWLYSRVVSRHLAIATQITIERLQPEAIQTLSMSSIAQTLQSC